MSLSPALDWIALIPNPLNDERVRGRKNDEGSLPSFYSSGGERRAAPRESERQELGRWRERMEAEMEMEGVDRKTRRGSERERTERPNHGKIERRIKRQIRRRPKTKVTLKDF